MSNIYINFNLTRTKKRIQYKTNDESIDTFLKDSFNIENPDKFIYSNNENRKIPEFINPFSAINSFDIGLMCEILIKLKKFNFLKINIHKDIYPLIKPFNYQIDNLIQPVNTKYVYREEQDFAIKKCLKHGRGVINYCTSAGKSLIQYGVVTNLNNLHKRGKTLLIVPNLQLVNQMYNDFIDYGYNKDNIAFYTKKINNINETSEVIITNTQFLCRNPITFQPDYVIVDECHGITHTSKIAKIVASYKTPIKFGFTGTVHEDKRSEWKMKGVIGNVLCTLVPNELQEKGDIAQTKFVFLKFDHNSPQPLPPLSIEDKIERAKEKFNLEWRYIEKNHKCISMIASILNKIQGNTIVLFDHNEYGEELFKNVTELCKDKQLFFINGSTEVSYRDNVKQLMEVKTNCLLVANTKCFSTGISIKNINNIFFAFTYGKGNIKILQSIGRGLRINNTKKHVSIYDTYHNYYYSFKHFTRRKELYSSNYIIDNCKEFSLKVDD